MPIDNTLYDRLGATWWDDDAALNSLRTWLNPGRFSYFRAVLLDRLHFDPAGKQTLDVGCGGGLLAEEFARLGCRVTGIDPSAPSIATARAHAQQEGLAIDYQLGVGEHLPFAGGSFDLVYCCDVLEHVAQLDQVISEIGRVLSPGGVFFYDTINRTMLSNLISIRFLQEWKATRLLPPNLHEWARFIRPQELQALLRQSRLIPQEIVGLGPRVNPLTAFSILRNVKRGTLSVKEAGARMDFGAIKDTSISYMGYALKA